VFSARSIEILGHKINDQGILKSNKHVEAVLSKSIEDVHLFLGKASYYTIFIPNLAS